MTLKWESTTTNSAGTEEWLEASKDMDISFHVVNGTESPETRGIDFTKDGFEVVLKKDRGPKSVKAY